MIDLFNSAEDYGKVLHVRVTAKAAANKIKVEHLAGGKKLIRIYVTVAAEDGKANREVIKLLAAELGLPKSALRITKGLTSRDKIISVISNI